ncbi:MULTISPECIES: hypothetical protein [unclassified Streptomyces]|uniref:hypothetical protein n=1 Tax=unclassified Streptomyces TaxID=2593676 RepID=UPI002DD91CF2|nr:MULTISPECIES: hypothetical protein [unclassified Streptomyces]WSB80695.1 hypothetical protein OHB04_36655 [Streptomyces sp. NBC_01775]WSS11096.1 hypothetical protein OG533_03595 [Streptomyces sp. NBC_01186]WSS39804.1 hypothetical protein OG220_03690 [Streptomyces sp. NBC_01187]
MRVGADDGDEIHWRRELPESNSAAAWRARQKLGAAARAMLRAGALAAHERAGYHGARHERRADAYAELARFEEGSGEGAGGRLLRARLPVATEAARRPLVALGKALRATADAVSSYRSTGATEHFDAVREHGVCQELTDSVCQLVRGTEGVRITLLWSASAGGPLGCPARPAPVVFTPGDLPALELAGRHYTRAEPSVPVRVTGAVVRLRRAEPSGSGSVRLKVLAGAEVVQVRARLEEDDYRVAVHAHLAGLPLRLSGLLESRGGFRRLSGAHGVVPVPAPEDARERLLKQLRHGLDGLECGLGG